MQEQLFKPLGMNDSSNVWRPEANSRMATGYDKPGGALEAYADVGRKLAPFA